ncbi:hypothetical protein L1887_23765 [Cichorium endivia]|nr:hypothetical protein L1887_23765 [Cichorium endivia]
MANAPRPLSSPPDSKPPACFPSPATMGSRTPPQTYCSGPTNPPFPSPALLPDSPPSSPAATTHPLRHSCHRHISIQPLAFSPPPKLTDATPTATTQHQPLTHIPG